jgi:hypothetical protein
MERGVPAGVPMADAKKPIGGGGARHPNSLANLRPGAGAWPPGAAPRLRHGLRTRRPDRLLLGGAASEIIDALEAGVPVRDADGDVPVHDRVAVEAAALQLIIVRRVLGFLTTNGFEDERGRLRPEVEGLERANARLLAALDRLGMTPASRVRLGLDLSRAFDLAAHWQREDAGS